MLDSHSVPHGRLGNKTSFFLASSGDSAHTRAAWRTLYLLHVLPLALVHPLVVLSSLVHSGSARGRWYKFNDNVVEEFDMNDETLEYECFGGEYRPKVYDQCV